MNDYIEQVFLAIRDIDADVWSVTNIEIETARKNLMRQWSQNNQDDALDKAFSNITSSINYSIKSSRIEADIAPEKIIAQRNKWGARVYKFQHSLLKMSLPSGLVTQISHATSTRSAG